MYAASKGIAIAKALVYEKHEIEVAKSSIEDVKGEHTRFEQAISAAYAEIEKIQTQTEKKMGKESADIFGAHLMVLNDPELISQVKSAIKNEKVNAEYALKNTVDTFVAMFEAMEDEYMKERAADIKDVSSRVLGHLQGIKNQDLTSLDEEVIVVAHDLAPSDTASMNKEKVMGFATNIGGSTSHTAIMARNLEIPAVVGAKDITEKVTGGDTLILDAINGQVIINPSEEQKENYLSKKQQFEQQKEKLKIFKNKQSSTKDGKVIELAANIGSPNDMGPVIANGAEGIGLYRTEFLYMDRSTSPTEDEQFESYKVVLKQMGKKPVVIRTLDIGGDKEIPYLNMPKEMNPFLGYRALRICLDKKEMFKTQLRALLRASQYGNLKVMYPMVSSVEEIRQANAVLEEVKQELTEKGTSFKDFEVGIMIEIPSAAINSDALAKEVDFFSIGTNDLIQYTVAVDRMNEKISHLYSPFNPAVLKLIDMTITNGHKNGIWVGMCGEAAGNLKMIPFLLGANLDEFSMSPSAILPARELISKLSTEETQEIKDKVLEMSSAKDIENFLNEVVSK
ncbi:phosphoenolpyruvate--protein phosphotransferase [Proteinivorax hydrogeniformans]|uniref:Phosphoenolpyruvate-protein phosphotransferase n=1 Tax=Proteinivorax hydrogeniformans TaxID=1826727 RepID=A0AAU8HSL3_9FIRM